DLYIRIQQSKALRKPLLQFQFLTGLLNISPGLMILGNQLNFGFFPFWEVCLNLKLNNPRLKLFTLKIIRGPKITMMSFANDLNLASFHVTIPSGIENNNPRDLILELI